MRFNFHYFPFRTALKFPVWVSRHVDLKTLKGKVEIQEPYFFKKIKIGFGHVHIFDKTYERSIWSVKGKVVFNGTASIGHGSRIYVGEKGVLTLDNNVCATAKASFICEKSISLGEDTLISWDTLIMDTDYHDIYNLQTNEVLNENKEVVLGPKTWIGCRALILKGTVTRQQTIVGASSVLNKDYKEGNIIVAGNPASIIKREVCW